MAKYIDKNKTTHEMWQKLYALEEKLEEEHGLDICERHDVQIGFEAGLEAVVNMPTIDIVHCGECCFYPKCDESISLDQDWFCADAIRRD